MLQPVVDKHHRLLLNVAATYGRSMVALAVGLFTSRWLLQALGEVDYGLFGAVGSLTVFVQFLNGLLATAVGRFYAVNGTDEARNWFGVAVVVHTVVPLALAAVGYPLGVWAVENWLSIPPDRMVASLWVWRFSVASCLVGMMSVPWTAMYVARQEIAEQTIYGFVTSLLHCGVSYWMLTSCPVDRLVTLGGWAFLMTALPTLVMSVRARFKFPECRLTASAFARFGARVRELVAYTGWSAFGMVGNLCRYNAMPVVVNKMLGPAFNSSLTIANSMAGNTASLGSSLEGALNPAIMNAFGAGRRDEAVSLMYRACKLGTLLVLLFAIPVALEADYIVRLWLKTPPPGVATLAVGVLASAVLEKLTCGHWIILAANGRIARYQMEMFAAYALTLPIAWLLIRMGKGLDAVAAAQIATILIACIVRVGAVRRLLGLSPVHWFLRILLPLVTLAVVVIALGLLPRLCLSAGFARFALTSAFCVVAMSACGWFVVLDRHEREFVKRHCRP